MQAGIDIIEKGHSLLRAAQGCINRNIIPKKVEVKVPLFGQINHTWVLYPVSRLATDRLVGEG